jgi:hypothetical protein
MKKIHYSIFGEILLLAISNSRPLDSPVTFRAALLSFRIPNMMMFHDACSSRSLCKLDSTDYNASPASTDLFS